MTPAVGTGDIFLSLGELFLFVYPSVETIPMHLAGDYIHPTPRGGRCRVQIYLPEDKQDSPVVIRSQLPAEYTPLFEAGSQGEMDA
jgi:hypothetical protein